MSDPTTPISAPTPVPFGAAATEPVHTEAPVPTDTADVSISFDFSPVSDVKASPHAWARYLREYLGHITGTWIDPEDLTDVFAAFTTQVAAAEAREASFTVANMQIPSSLTGDAGLVALQLRGDISALLRKRAGLS